MHRYRIEPTQSSVWIDARSNVHPIHSKTDGLEGEIDLEVDADGRIDLSVAPKGRLSLPVTKLKAGNPLEERELKRRIDARRYPTIDGELTEMVADGDDGNFRVTGLITFRGVTKSRTDNMVVIVDNDTVRLLGEASFDIRDFGMEPPRILVLRVEPEVQVRVEIEAHRVT